MQWNYIERQGKSFHIFIHKTVYKDFEFPVKPCIHFEVARVTKLGIFRSIWNENITSVFDYNSPSLISYINRTNRGTPLNSLTESQTRLDWICTQAKNDAH